jgi:hypothetical protein
VPRNPAASHSDSGVPWPTIIGLLTSREGESPRRPALHDEGAESFQVCFSVALAEVHGQIGGQTGEARVRSERAGSESTADTVEYVRGNPLGSGPQSGSPKLTALLMVQWVGIDLFGRHIESGGKPAQRGIDGPEVG